VLGEQKKRTASTTFNWRIWIDRYYIWWD
jgi:hypothetical protein